MSGPIGAAVLVLVGYLLGLSGDLTLDKLQQQWQEAQADFTQPFEVPAPSRRPARAPTS